MSSFQPNWASKPGDTILDILRERKISTETFVEQMGQSADRVHQLIYGSKPITTETAFQLSNILGASEQFWLNREKQYRESLLSIDKVNEEKWLKDIPFKEMVEMGWIQDTHNRLESCLKFFNIENVNQWNKQYRSHIRETVSFRSSPTFKSKLIPITCWLRQGEKIAESINCKPWNRDALKGAIESLRKLTKEKKPKTYIPKLKAICAECGVAVAIVRTPKKTSTYGAIKFISKDKALLVLSFRYRSDDQFWFTFFHEVGHLLLHENKGILVDGLINDEGAAAANSTVEEQENEANDFAGEILIPKRFHGQLKNLTGNTRKIIAFANEVGVSPGIVVGQMQHFNYISKAYLNNFKKRYDLEDIPFE
ncbi:ImmA/IrrE family metallo-endopeptidase [Spirosoma litoris]